MTLIDRGRRLARRVLDGLDRRLAPERPMTCIGHSHLRAVEAAAAEQGLALNAINFWATPDAWVDEGGKRNLSPVLLDRLRRGPVFSLIGGGSHSVFMAAHPEPFDFVLPQAPDLPLDEGVRIIPVEALREILLADMRTYFDIFDMVLAVTRRPMFHLETPPPYADDTLMAQTMYWPADENRLRQIAPKYLRYKFWRLHSSMVEEFCRGRGIGFIAHPAASTDADGFLARDYYFDCAHAGPAYGALLLDQMRQRR